MTANPIERCLILYSEAQWHAFNEQLKREKRDVHIRRFERFLAEHTMEGVACDSQGRLLLTPQQREFCRIEKDVTTVRMPDRVELWAKERYEEQFPSDEEVADTAERLGFF